MDLNCVKEGDRLLVITLIAGDKKKETVTVVKKKRQWLLTDDNRKFDLETGIMRGKRSCRVTKIL